MRRLIRVFSVLLPVCLAVTGTACADYGITSVDQLPMAVDFSVKVNFDADGNPQVVTDYPFESAGADEMNLIYSKGDVYEAISLNYRFRTGVTRVGSWDSRVYDSDTGFSDAFRDIRSGELKLEDEIHINTSRFSKYETDWVLTYSSAEKRYTGYEEVDNAQAFNAMGAGGRSKSIWFRDDGTINDARLLYRIEDADMIVHYNRFGEIESGYIQQYSPSYATYDYDPGTGLFAGKPMTAYGFEETDLAAESFAAADAKTGTEVRVAAPQAETHTYFPLVGGLLSGILMGVALYYTFRRRRQEKKDAAARKTDGAPAPETKQEGAETPPEPVEPPQMMSSSNG